jgi:fucose permease
MSNRHQQAFTAIALGTIATVGLWEGSRGVLLPHFLGDLKLTATVGGAVFSSTAIGYMTNSLAFGTLSHRFGLKRVVATGLGLLAVMMTLFITLKIPALLYVVNVFLGMGISMIEMATSIMISLLYQEKQSGMLNLLHGFFGTGAFLGSLWAAFWLGLGTGWRVPFGLVALILAAWGISFLPLPEHPLPKEEDGRGGYGPLLKDPLVWAAAIGLFMAVVGEVGNTLWLPSYLQKVKGYGEALSAGYMTAFFVGFTATRLAGSWLVGRLGQVRTVLALALVGVVAMVTLLAWPAAPIWLPVLCGAGVATGFATCTALVATRYPERVNQVYTVMYSAGGLAGILTGPFMGWLGDRAGLQFSMWVPLIAYGLLAVLMGYYGLAGNRASRSGAAAAERIG